MVSTESVVDLVLYLVVAPIWLILTVFVLLPFAILLGIANALVEIFVLLAGKSLNSYPRRLRFLNRWGNRIFRWVDENIRWIASGPGMGNFELFP